MRYIKKLITAIKSRDAANHKKSAEAEAAEHLGSSLNMNLTALKETLGDSSDIVIKEFWIGYERLIKCALICIDGLVDMDLIGREILRPLMYDTTCRISIGEDGSHCIESLRSEVLLTSDTKRITTFEDLLNDLLSGNTILLVDQSNEALSLSARNWEKRGIEEPATENVLRGPRQGFTETLRSNTSMLRRIIKNPKLQFESMKIGKQTKTDVALAYIKDIAKDEIIEEIRTRLQNINMDSILSSGYVEALVSDAPFSIFSLLGYSERPDVIAGKMLEGRVAVIVDGSPIVITAPMVFIEQFQSPEDYYIKPYYATYLRTIRFISYFISVLAPAIYVAITTFHQELIPTSLLFTMTAGISGIPFPALVEALVMVVTFDILKEAGIRLPKPIGSAISIVGALVIGDAAVSAGLIGPFMVIVVSITAITSFNIPKEFDSSTVIRYTMLILAGFLGGFGMVMGIIALLLYLVSLQSFGVPYLSPIMPVRREGMKDTLIRTPLRYMKMRPEDIAGQNQRRR